MDVHQPVIRRVKKVQKGGAHGGSWKIALADFALAMMAFFLVMWIINVASPQERAAIEGFFNDPMGPSTAGFSNKPIDLGGSPAKSIEQKPDFDLPDPGSTPLPAREEEVGSGNDGQELERMNALLTEQLQSIDRLHSENENMRIDITPDGVRITLIDEPDKPMFERGSAELTIDAEVVLLSIGSVLRKIENPIAITGHTDSTRFLSQDYTDNWDLSSLRANAAKRAVVEGGVSLSRIAQVVGLADTVPYNRLDPQSAENRRITITILTDSSYRDLLARNRDRFGFDSVNLRGVAPKSVF
ncbi:flagellar motor protein [Maribrevibacterium harenarium]|uniref:Flagellar motor protein n=1 Tax=Maribrevibacterium harenarium TaxID=2589817 RepID=A0A501WYB6_9GAMM|nr:OmpA family protein [Maribrevibacterium harenarium]TPE52011.1 flagellar motor protein [Maribrevibacterium harenarium]